MNWRNITYLKSGTPRQQAAYYALQRLKIFERLAAYKPILTGTIPLDIDIPDSDLDVICQVEDLPAFEALLLRYFAAEDGFTLRRQEANGLPVVVCNFEADGWPIEIFAQPRPVRRQNAYRHLVAEARLLLLAEDEAKRNIRQLKGAGLKTEPAFGEYFALPGNPFSTLYNLSDAPDAELRQLITHAEKIRQSCVFCRIARGESEASLVYANAFTLAFMNRRQANRGHVLVIPRRHVQTIFDLDDGLAAELAKTVVKVSRALKEALQVSDLSVWQSNGAAAFQEIPHLHIHLLPRYADDSLVQVYPDLPPLAKRELRDDLAAQIGETMKSSKFKL
ncbi:MAG TPA: DUF4269 domain-containing protein [Chloroflexi bacterium]|nr:MAG: hypothetical protein B6243_05760 [Anaerolineaceae bacterium 4572_5.2]HEY84271.1 DUF4269 domain-containing protein [Chloroflexota bacterium]